MTFGKPPVQVKEIDPPVTAVERWHKVDGHLIKSYQFRRPKDRIRFVNSLMRYEDKVNHHAVMTIEFDKVSLEVFTKELDNVTELDKEHARFADVLFYDIVYNVSYDDRDQATDRRYFDE